MKILVNKDTYEFEINIKWISKIKFIVDFGKETIPQLLMDESKSLIGGDELGPSASMLLAASVGNCMATSLAHCLMRKRVELESLKTVVKLTRKKNEKGFFRYTNIEVTMDPKLKDNQNLKNYKRCLEIFNEYDTVSNSIQEGIKINYKIASLD